MPRIAGEHGGMPSADPYGEMNEMMIEQLQGDAAAIAPLIGEYKRAIGEEPLQTEALAALQAAIQRGDIVFFVAMDGDAPAAMCSVTRTFSTYRCAYGGIFEDFYVRPQYRKTGLARALVDRAFAFCREHGIASLWVGSADCDVQMYRHLGFTVPLGNLLAWSAE